MNSLDTNLVLVKLVEKQFSTHENLYAQQHQLAPLIDAYIAFDNGTSMNTIEQVSCFSDLPALPLRGSVSFGDLLGWDNPEKKAIRTTLSNMSSNSYSKLELPPNWSRE
ncbi:hypothetical protein ZWY2020_018675 [Hordeum vulgare]|nr:hypothetical protein ZWY2020_018675 [Hordeum vulgare]